MFIKNIKYLFIFITMNLLLLHADVDLQEAIYDSAQEMISFDEKMNRVIAEHNGDTYEGYESQSQIVDFEETEDGYLLERTITNENSNNTKIELKLENRMLTIITTTKEKEKIVDERGDGYETTINESSSSIYLPSNADEKTMQDSFINGTLKITFQKIEK